MRLALLACVVLLLPSVAAGPAPLLYFLKDDGSSLDAGTLNLTGPDALDPSSRLVLAGSPDGASAVFETEHSRGRLLGPVIVGLWLGPSPVIEGDLRASLYDGDTLIATANQSIAADRTPPDPLSFIPPDPTNPQAAIAYVAAKSLAGIIHPPILFQLGFVDVNASSLRLAFNLEASEGAVVSIGGPAVIEYDATLKPSFLYAPWYLPDAPREPVSEAPDEVDEGGPVNPPVPVKPTPIGPGASLLAVGLALTLRRLR